VSKTWLITGTSSGLGRCRQCKAGTSACAGQHRLRLYLAGLAQRLAAIPLKTGRVALATGANSGLGFQTARMRADPR
jgi:NADP-dependent 3-hydroxy acid dehydrogenase YdfG